MLILKLKYIFTKEHMIFMSAFILTGRHTHQCPFYRGEQSSAGAWEKPIGRAVMCVRYRWSRHWLGRMYCENPRTAMLSGPDHTPHLYIPSMTLTILVHTPLSNIPGVRYIEDTATRYNKYNTDSGNNIEGRDLACSEKSFIARMCRPTFEPSTYWVMEKVVNSSSALSSYREVRPHLVFHQARGKGRLWCVSKTTTVL